MADGRLSLACLHRKLSRLATDHHVNPNEMRSLAVKANDFDPSSPSIDRNRGLVGLEGTSMSTRERGLRKAFALKSQR